MKWRLCKPAIRSQAPSPFGDRQLFLAEIRQVKGLDAVDIRGKLSVEFDLRDFEKKPVQPFNQSDSLAICLFHQLIPLKQALFRQWFDTTLHYLG